MVLKGMELPKDTRVYPKKGNAQDHVILLFIKRPIFQIDPKMVKSCDKN